MCGIAGLFEPRGGAGDALVARAGAMARALAHRGPDDDGVHVDAARGVALAHRRLAVIDLSPTGRQPMVSDDGRYALVYNGEVYNARALTERYRLACRGTSDTEVLLLAIAARGVVDVVGAVEGMFAFALWDAVEETLTFARDRFGKKPLFVAHTAHGIAFASELRALLVDDTVDRAVDREAVARYFERGAVPGLRTILRDVERVPAGHVVTYARAGAGVRARSSTRFFDVESLVARAPAARRRDADAHDHVERALEAAVARRLVSDVPLGAFLSSGVDSTLVVALMKRAGVERPRTFTIAFPGTDHDEGPRARAIARALGTEHHEEALDARALLASYREWMERLDEPFADSSLLPTACVSRLARTAVTVALSGDGADELFGGYRQHAWVPRLWPLVARVPHALRTRGARAARRVVARLPARATSLGRGYLRPDAVAKLARLAAAPDMAAFHLALRCVCLPDDNPVAGAPWPRDAAARFFAAHDVIDAVRLFDLVTYLVDDILPKVDRASMAYGLEVRSPFLDLDVARAAFDVDPSLLVPRRARLDGRDQKAILRRLVARHVDPALLSPTKRGFAVPLAGWFRGPLRELVVELTAPTRVEALGLSARRVARLRDDHLAGRANMAEALHAVMMLVAWTERLGARA